MTGFLYQGGDLSTRFITEDELEKFTGKELVLSGYGSLGNLGSNSVNNYSVPTQTISRGTNWKQVSVFGNAADIKTDGSLWLWGAGDSGALGNNAITRRSSPVQTVSGGTDWKQVSASGDFTAAIKTDGTLWTWGAGIDGRLGNNSAVSRSSPVQTVSGGTDWKLVSAGVNHTSAIKTNGTLWTWGCGGRGGLGNDSVINRSSPVQTVSGGTNWKQTSSGQYNTAAIKTDGTLWAWGYNSYGQLGNNSILAVSSPVQTVTGGTDWKQASVGACQIGAIKTDGSLWIWGEGTDGRLGNNAITDRSSPIQTVSAGTNWKQLSVGGCFTAAIKTDGTLWLWGSNFQQNIGDGTNISRSSPVQTISGGTNWKQVSTTSNNAYHAALRYPD